MKLLLGLMMLALVSAPAAAQTDTLVGIRDLSAREHRMQALVLPRAQELQVKAVGGEPRGTSAFGRFLQHGIFMNRHRDDLGDVWPANAWILDAGTRQVVWELRTAPTQEQGGGLRMFEGTLQLQAGAYEVHYAALYAVAGFAGDDNNDWRARGWDTGADLEGPYLDDDRYREFGIVIRGAGSHGAEVADATGEGAAGQFAALKGAQGEARERVGFALARATAVEIRALGEEVDDDWFDYGWIDDAASGETVWTFGDGAVSHAGGAEKNRAVVDQVTLPAGRYLAYYVTDGSHQAGAWTQAPPYDPSAWGLTIRAIDAATAAHVTTFQPPFPADEAVIALTAMGDRELEGQPFVVERPLEIRIFALGEGGRGEMHDYGWIVGGAGRAIWRMEYGGTRSAGGATKNRLFDGTMRLEPGRYTAYFMTDGSHSFGGGFNASRPFDAEHWGMTILPANGATKQDFILEQADKPDPSVLARIVKVGDGRQEEARFHLTRDGSVRVLAIGEGSGEMYDYAWIENASGTVVWRMTYNGTEHAGGATKNRRVDEVISLPAGEYTVRYRSDGSYSFQDWNADPPDDPLHWGVTVSRAGGG